MGDFPRDKSNAHRYGPGPIPNNLPTEVRAMRRHLFAAPALLSAMLFLYGCAWTQSLHPGNQVAMVDVGQTAPDVDAEDLEGQRMQLSEFRGNVVVLHFWANW
jgi:hypothetical protein